jgi:hypothetical protein
MAKNPRLIDLAGQRFERLTIVGQAGNSPRGAALWNYQCDCGVLGVATGSDLRTGKTKSCGCMRTDRAARLNKTHGATGSRVYQTWQNMRARCLNPNSLGYANYGGRGIKICPEWETFPGFQDWVHSSGWKDGLSIERIDVNGDYSPDNCTWADAATQNANRRFVAVAPDGELWWHKAQSNGITAAAYRTRLFAGWPIEEAATHPMHVRRFARRRDQSGKFAASLPRI